jgi:hypothetical protein
LLNTEIEDAYRIADNLMAMVTDDELAWKPVTGTNWMTMGQLLMHMTTACGFCCRAFMTGNWDPPEGYDPADVSPESGQPPAEKMPTVESVADARRRLAEDKQIAVAMVSEAGEEDLANKMVPAPWEESPSKVLGYQFLYMITHLNQHKNQLFYYLKLQGKPVNTMHLWGA